MKKLMIYFMLCICMLSLTSAYTGHEQNTDFNLVVNSNNATQCNLTAIENPESLSLFILIMQRNSQTFNLTVDSTNFSVLGDTCMSIICTDSIEYEPGSVCREVTPSGQNMSISQAIIFSIIFILIFIILFFGIYGVMRAEKFEWQIFYVCLTYLSLFSLSFVCWLFSNNYLWDTPIIASIFWIVWLVLAICFFPFIVLLSAYLLKKQAELLMMNDLVSQGYSKEESKHMSKRRNQ